MIILNVRAIDFIGIYPDRSVLFQKMMEEEEWTLDDVAVLGQTALN